MTSTQPTRILLLSIPNGSALSDDPPIGASRVADGLDPALGCDVRFLDLYLEQLSFDEIRRRVAEFSPHIIGYSAILVHTYAYVKKLSLFLKEAFPDSIQVLGGGMAVAANIVLRKTKVDFCVSGDSEPTFSQLVAELQRNRFDLAAPAGYRDIKGLVFLDEGKPHFTGYAPPPPVIRQVNWDFVAKFTRLEHYMPPAGSRYARGIHKNSLDTFLSTFRPENLNKRMAPVCASIGCVAHCTFCHRFFKGYRAMDPDGLIAHIEELTKKYDIGMIMFAEENFGSDKRATAKLIEYLKGKKLNWVCSATRARTVKEETLRAWKESGCVHVNSGIESASAKMLEVMDKVTSVQDNLNMLLTCNKVDVFTGLTLLVGMPGESDATIDETIDNLSKALPDNFDWPFDMAINYFQAVPGTPGYEYARAVGMIGDSIEAEESYIENIYNVDADKLRHYLNFTDLETEELAYWRDYIMLELVTAYMRKHGVLRCLLHKDIPRYRYAAVYMLLPRPARRFLLRYLDVVRFFGTAGLLRLMHKKLFHPKPKRFSDVKNSLRREVKEIGLAAREDDQTTALLRAGR